jgi:integrase
MATIQKRSGSFRATIRLRGIYESETFATKREADTWATQVEAEIIAGKRGQIPNKEFSAALTRYMEHVTPLKRSKDWETNKIKFLLEDPIAKVNLREFDETSAAAWRDRRLKSVSAGTVRREWNVLSNLCEVAVKEWKWLRLNPFRNIKRPAPPPPRDQIYSDDEIAEILKLTGYSIEEPPVSTMAKVGAIFVFAIETGMRLKEMCRLTWDRVHLKKRYVHVNDDSKTLRRDVPLSSRAAAIIEQMLPFKDVDDPRVFHLNESQVDANFRKYKNKLQTTVSKTFHDTKHTACTRLAKKVKVLDLARIVGTNDLKTLMIYYNESATNIAQYLD